MAKANDDKHTLELPGIPVAKRRGRRPTGNAKPAAERMAAYRERRRAEGAQLGADLGAAIDGIASIQAEMVRLGDPALVDVATVRQKWAEWYKALHEAGKALGSVRAVLSKQKQPGEGGA